MSTNDETHPTLPSATEEANADANTDSLSMEDPCEAKSLDMKTIEEFDKKMEKEESANPPTVELASASSISRNVLTGCGVFAYGDGGVRPFKTKERELNPITAFNEDAGFNVFKATKTKERDANPITLFLDGGNAAPPKRIKTKERDANPITAFTLNDGPADRKPIKTKERDINPITGERYESGPMSPRMRGDKKKQFPPAGNSSDMA